MRSRSPSQDPGDLQAADARAGFVTGLRASGVLNTGITGRASRIARGELVNPQPRGSHVAVTAMVIQHSSVGVQQTARFPGRVAPTVWDGEPGATSPVAGTV